LRKTVINIQSHIVAVAVIHYINNCQKMCCLCKSSILYIYRVYSWCTNFCDHKSLCDS